MEGKKALEEDESLTGIQDTLHLIMYLFTCETLASKQTLATTFYIQLLQIQIKVALIHSE